MLKKEHDKIISNPKGGKMELIEFILSLVILIVVLLFGFKDMAAHRLLVRILVGEELKKYQIKSSIPGYSFYYWKKYIKNHTKELKED